MGITIKPDSEKPAALLPKRSESQKAKPINKKNSTIMPNPATVSMPAAAAEPAAIFSTSERE